MSGPNHIGFRERSTQSNYDRQRYLTPKDATVGQTPPSEQSSGEIGFSEFLQEDWPTAGASALVQTRTPTDFQSRPSDITHLERQAFLQAQLHPPPRFLKVPQTGPWKVLEL